MDNRKAVLDLQRLTDRAVQRFASASPAAPIGKLQANHLKAYLSQIESALSALRQDDTVNDYMADELDVVETQLSLLRSVYERSSSGSTNAAGAAGVKKTWAQVVFDSDTNDDNDNDDDDSKPLLPSPKAVESRYSTSLRQRPYHLNHTLTN